MSEDIIQILQRLSAGDVDAPMLLTVNGGRVWVIPSGCPTGYLRSETRIRQAEIREAIRSDPSRDYRAVARRYRVSIQTVYKAWNEKAG